MNTIDVLYVRIFMTEGSHLLKPTFEYLQKEAKIRGISVFRAVSGFGETGTHALSWVDLSLDLPLVIEFFDEKDKVERALEHLNATIKPEHMVFWPAKANAV